MLTEAELVAFVPSEDIDRSRRFYERTLALRLVEQTAFACVFQAPNAQLRVTLVERAARAPYTVLGWQVADLAAMVHELRARGIETRRYDGLVQDELNVWRAPSGAQVIWFEDPDGNLLSLTQG